MMGISDEFFAICTRGAAKSFLVGIGAMCELCLKPYSEIVITSSTIPQAAKLVEKKIRDEIIKKLSPYLLYMYEHEYIVITKSSTQDGGAYVVENKLNGSTITVLPCLDSSRGSRSTWNIYEEARLLKKNIIDSVFEPMGHSRPAKYLLKKEYQTKRWLEKARSTYITSSRFKYEWFWRKFKDTVTNYYISDQETYIPFAEDIFAAISDGSRTWADYRKNKKTMNELDFKMEILNEMIGEAEDAFFNYKSFRENQTIKSFYKFPKESDMLVGNVFENRKKEPQEIRIVAVDYAFANTTSKEKNDNTIIICMSGLWRNNHFERYVDYIEGHSASDSIGAADRARELWELYEADVLVPDARSGGEVLLNHMTMPWNPTFGRTRFSGRGLTVYDKNWVHVVSDAKLADLRDRTVDKNAVPAIVPFIGTGDLNVSAWTELKKQLESNNIKFLVSAQQHQEDIEDNGEYFKLTTEELVQELLPYGQTDELIQEAVNLSLEITSKGFRLVEPRSGTKDRAVILSYANYIMSLFENQWQKLMQDSDEDIEELQLVW